MMAVESCSIATQVAGLDQFEVIVYVTTLK